MVVIDRRNNTYEIFRDKAVLAMHLGLAPDTVNGWFRKQENGKKPKTKIYNHLEIIDIDGEYINKKHRPFGGRAPGDDT